MRERSMLDKTRQMTLIRVYRQQAATVKGGLKYGSIGLVSSVGASVAAQRFFPAYRSLVSSVFLSYAAS